MLCIQRGFVTERLQVFGYVGWFLIKDMQRCIEDFFKSAGEPRLTSGGLRSKCKHRAES